MREFVQYVASDGAVFDTKEECLEYEAVEASKHSVISYDSTTLKQTSYEIADAMYLHDEDAVEAFMKVSDYYGFYTDGVNRPGAYILDPVDGGSWLRIDDCIEKLQNLVKIMYKDWEQNVYQEDDSE